jgi:hypothetical protein
VFPNNVRSALNLVGAPRTDGVSFLVMVRDCSPIRGLR